MTNLTDIISFFIHEIPNVTTIDLYHLSKWASTLSVNGILIFVHV